MKLFITNAFNRFRSTPIFVQILSYIVASYALYAILVGLALPEIIQANAPKQIGERIGREVQLGEVKINPFLLQVQIGDFAILEQDKSNDFVRVNQLQLEFNFWQSITSLTPTLEYFLLDQPYIKVVRLKAISGQHPFSFDDIIETLAATQSLEQAERSEPIPQELSEEEIDGMTAFKAHVISLQQGQVEFEDKQANVKLGYQDINVQLKEFDTTALTINASSTTVDTQAQSNHNANLYSITMNGADESVFETNGQFQLQPFEVKGGLSLSSLKLSPFWPFTGDLIEAKLSKGEVSLSSDYHVNEQNKQMSFRLNNGAFSLADLQFIYNNQPQIKLQQLDLTGIELDGDTRGITVDKLLMNGLWLDAILSDKGLDLQQHFTPKPVSKVTTVSNGDVSEQSTENSETPWLVRLNAFEMQQTDINLKEDLISQGVHWRVFPLNVTVGPMLSDLSLPLEYKVDLGLSSDIAKQPDRIRGEFTSVGLFDINTSELDSELTLSALDLTQFQPYVDPYLNIMLSKGSMTTKGKIVANSRGKAIYQGELAIDQLLLKDDLQKEPLLQWKQMLIDSLTFDQDKRHIDIKTILLNTPYAKMIIDKDLQTNVGAVAKSSNAVDSPETSQDSATSTVQDLSAKPSEVQENRDFVLDIGRIDIVDGSAFFADFSLTPNFASGIESLEGFVKNISTKPGTKAEVDIKGKIDKYAPVSLKGEINPLIDSPYLDLDFSLSSVELTSVNPYSGTYAGYYIDKGQLSLDINYRLENNQLEGTNHVVVDQLEFGKPSDSSIATSLPITLAVGLLQDGDGVIDLGFGVNGDVESPEFSFGGVILKAVMNIITKAITAPFSLLADLVGSDDELDFVQFEFGEATLDAAGEDRLLKLAEALNARPNLRLSVEGSVLIMEDSRAIAEQSLQEKLLTIGGLTELPAEFSPSRIPSTGALPEALETLFVQELSIDLDEEREKVKQVLTESAKANDDQTAEPVKITSEQVTTTLHIGMYNQLLNAQQVNEHDLGALAQERAQVVKGFLLENEIAPKRVFILDSKSALKTEQSQALMTIDID